VRHLGLDLGGTDIKLALLDDDEVRATDTAPTRSEAGPPAGVIERVLELGRSAGPFDTVGVSVPGLVDESGCAVLFPNLRGDWIGFPVRALLEEGFGRPIALLNDGNAFALAEARIGAARGAEDVICVVCGTGVGGGLVLDGQLRLGVEDRAGEIGHHTVAVDGEPCGCGNHGCLETIAGARAIAHAAGRGSFADTLAAARAGDPQALEAIARAGRMLGVAIANLTIFVAPRRVVVGGGVAEAGELLLGPLREEVRRRAGSVAPLEQIAIVAAQLGPFAGAIGAALHGADRGAPTPREVHA
jgi:glucokinase